MDKNSKTILLVDDEERLRITLSDCLRAVGYDVVAASNGEDALAQAARRDPDLVVLDISMPGMGGMGFLRRITTESGQTRWPVLVLTARSNMEEFFGDIAVEGFLSKTCTRGEFLHRVEAALHRHRHRDPDGSVRRTRVLLGEDDPRTAEMIRRAFEPAGHDIEVARDGAEVVEKAVSCAPDAIVLKQVLPRMNGSAVVPLLARMSSTSGVPIVLYDEHVPQPGAHKPGEVSEWVTEATASELLAATERALQRRAT